MHVLLFSRPAAFALLAATPWIWWLHAAGYGGLSRARGIVALEIRLLLAGLFVILLAEPRAVRTQDVMAVIYALDVSDSIEGNDREQRVSKGALSFVAKTATTKPVNDEVGLIVFGRNAAAEFPAHTTLPLDK